MIRQFMCKILGHKFPPELFDRNQFVPKGYYIALSQKCKRCGVVDRFIWKQVNEKELLGERKG
jgi:hypothetical protein